MKQQWQQYKEILNTVVKPALGCTEPISAAYDILSRGQDGGYTRQSSRVCVG